MTRWDDPDADPMADIRDAIDNASESGWYGGTMTYQREPDAEAELVTPSVIYAVFPGDDVDRDENGMWLPKVGDKVVSVTAMLERVDPDDDDLPVYRIVAPGPVS